MRLNDDDMTTTGSNGSEGPADAGAGEQVDPNDHDGGADGGATHRGTLRRRGG